MAERASGDYRPDGISDALKEAAEGSETPETTGAPTAGDQQESSAPLVVKGIGVRGMLRFLWRQVTSMRTALMLLMLLAVAAVPGSIIPQRDSNPDGYARYVAEHADLSRWLDRFQVFDVYTSVWFSAIYLLLFISLVGCILPRTWLHLRSLRTAPPKAPRRFGRLPAHASLAALDPSAADQAIANATAFLRGRNPLWRRYRIVEATEADGARTLSAERGYLREAGNLVFHLALVGLLIAVATGQLLHYRGQVILVQGRGFANAEVNYNTFSSGAWFTSDSLDPFTMTLDKFEAKFRASDAQAQDFTASVTVHDGDTKAERTIKVNHPLLIGGAKVYLQGNGYAPKVTITDADGKTAFAGSVPFIPQDQVYTSQGTIKVPDVTSGDQIGLVGYLLPTGTQSTDGTWGSIFPQPLNPTLVLTVWRGDLGLDTGVPQNVYQLDTGAMTQVRDDSGQPVTLVVTPGETVELPDGLGTLSFDGLDRFVALDLRHDPALRYVLISALTALVGLALSLFVPRRRVWLRWRDGIVETGGLARSEDSGLEREVLRLAQVAAGHDTHEATDDVSPEGHGEGSDDAR